MEVRAATQADIPVIMTLERLDGYEPLVGRWEVDQHAAEMRDPSTRYLVAREAGEIAAFAILQGLASPNRCLRLRRIIARNPERGTGSKFLRSILDICFTELAAHRVSFTSISITSVRAGFTRRSALPRKAFCATFIEPRMAASGRCG